MEPELQGWLPQSAYTPPASPLKPKLTKCSRLDSQIKAFCFEPITHVLRVQGRLYVLEADCCFDSGEEGEVSH